MNRRVLTRLTRKLAARRIAAKRKGQGAASERLRKRVEIIKGLMAP